VVRDEHESGRHDAIGEDVPPAGQAVKSFDRYRRIWCAFAGPAVLAASVLLVATPGAEAPPQFLKAMAKTAQAAAENEKRGEAALKLSCGGA
jgi:hypothetical protein